MNRTMKYGLGLFAAWMAWEWWKNKAHAATLPALPSSTPGIDTPVLGAGTLMVTAPAPLPGASAPTAAQLAAAGNFWSTLAPMIPPGAGYINFPGGSQAAASTFRYGTFAVDSAGNQFVQWAGQVYQLPLSPDINGNWPATLVTA
jgi:hypothetical protein